MTKHTGGPWQSRSEYEPWLIIGNVDGEIHYDGSASYSYKSICEICEDDGEQAENFANARLIAAAPDLLAVCTRALDFIGVYKTATHPRAEVSKALQAVIAKATN